jgi:hypothetical protein
MFNFSQITTAVSAASFLLNFTSYISNRIHFRATEWAQSHYDQFGLINQQPGHQGPATIIRACTDTANHARRLAYFTGFSTYYLKLRVLLEIPIVSHTTYSAIFRIPSPSPAEASLPKRYGDHLEG